MCSECSPCFDKIFEFNIIQAKNIIHQIKYASDINTLLRFNIYSLCQNISTQQLVGKLLFSENGYTHTGLALGLYTICTLHVDDCGRCWVFLLDAAARRLLAEVICQQPATKGWTCCIPEPRSL